MSPAAVVVAHRAAMVADGIASALARYPAIVPIAAVTSTAAAERCGERADAVALDLYLPDAEGAAGRLRRRGVRVVILGEPTGEEDDGLRVSTKAHIASLAAALVPNVAFARRGCVELTAREHQVITLVGRGLAGKQVARHLGISPKTVEQHKTRIFAKLGVSNQTAAVAALNNAMDGRSPWILSSS